MSMFGRYIYMCVLELLLYNVGQFAHSDEHLGGSYLECIVLCIIIR